MSHDLGAQLTLARHDLRCLASSVRHAHHLDTAAPAARIASGRPSGRPASELDAPWQQDTPTHSGLQRLSHVIAHAHWLYGELPDGQTIWPVQPIHGGGRGYQEPPSHARDLATWDVTGRTVPARELLIGIARLDLCLAELQRHRHDLGAQEISYAMDIVDTARIAINALPENVWLDRAGHYRPCGVCGGPTDDTGHECWSCRKRISRLIRRGLDWYTERGQHHTLVTP